MPDVLQSCHWYAYEVGLLYHEPLDDVNVEPCTLFPLTDGAAVLDGGDTNGSDDRGLGRGGPPETRQPLAAVTTARMVRPTSPLARV